jgi:hypothetical protein
MRPREMDAARRRRLLCCLRFGPTELHALRFGKRPGAARWGAYPNEILLWRVPLESAEVRLRLGRTLKDVRRDAALFQRFA